MEDGPPDPEELRRWGHAAVDLMVEHLTTLADRPVFQPMTPAERAALTDRPVPDAPVPFDEQLAFVRDRVLTRPMGYGHPRFFGWASCAVQPEAVLAEMLAAAMNPSCAGGDHAAIHLETGVVRWMAELLGLPGAGGLLVTGGSAAALTALAAARHRAAARRGWDVRAEGFSGERAGRLALYLSTEAHSCHRKAAQLLGLGDRAVREIAVDDRGRLDVDDLADRLRRDRADGWQPMAVVASAGTVNSGAVDPLAAIAERCGDDVWLHIDGSIGAIARLDPDKAPLFAGVERADSLAFDPHKWLSVPIDCAVLLARHPDGLRDTFSLVPPYLRAEPDRGFGGPWFAEYGFDQTRPFRALKLWAAVAAIGRDGLVRRIRANHATAARFAAAVAATDDLELMGPPTLSTVLFRVAGSDERNRAVALTLQERGEVFLTTTRFAGVEALRVAFLHHGSTTADVDRVIPAVLAAAADHA